MDSLPWGKNIIVFRGNLIKQLPAFIIANGSVAMGRKVTMFFTFWGLNILRNPRKLDELRKQLLEKCLENDATWSKEIKIMSNEHGGHWF